MRRLSWLLSVAVMCSVGCGESGPERIGLSGEVSYNGEPIEDGEIAFHPVDGTEAPPTSTLIMDGKYKLPPKWELVPGTYKVMVRSYRISASDGKLPGSTLDRPPPPGGIEVKDQLLPEKFNTKSTIEKFTVSAGDPPVEKNFELKD